MIIDQEVEIKVNGKIMSYYKEIGYELKEYKKYEGQKSNFKGNAGFGTGKKLG